MRGWASHRFHPWMRRTAATSAAFGLSLAAAGCYTLLKHPPASDPTSGFTGECTRCHNEAGVVETGYGPWMDYLRYSGAGWINYYGSPHWLDSRWARVSKQDPEEPDRPSGRVAWGRVPMSRGQAADGAPRTRDPQAPPPVPAPVAGASDSPAAPPAPTSEGAQPQEPPEEDEPKRLPPSGRGLKR